MLDKRCGRLLEIINNKCNDSGYKVIEIEELRQDMPEYFGETKESIAEHLSYLSSREYINVKYQDDTEVCVLPLTKGRLVTERAEDDEIERKKDRKSYFVYSFLGSVVGGLVVAVIVALIAIFGV